VTITFNEVAELYQEVRPRYPERIVDQIIAFSGLSSRGRVLEVGCGTGQMTLPFAKRGHEIVALDSGERLAALAARHCRPYPQVSVVACAFEDWQQAATGFDLLLSAQAFHWIDASYGLARAAELLKEGGTIALVWTLDRSQASAFWKATEPIYDRYNPQGSSGNPPLEARVDIYRRALGNSRDFVGMDEVRHTWTKRYAGEEYLKLLQTFSDHRVMPERFFEEISGVIAKMGGEVVRDYETLAILARKGHRESVEVAK
jgi:SAM-dependent methyltransferase